MALGAGHRAAYLNQQAGYTLGIAAKEEAEIEEIVENPTLLEDVGNAKSAVEAAMKDKSLMAEESKQLTTIQDEKVRAAKVVRRKMVKRATRALRMGKKASRTTSSRSVGRTASRRSSSSSRE